MQAAITAGAVLYAKDLGLISDFYAAVAGLTITDSAPDHVVMTAGCFQLVVVAVPPHLAADIHIQSPPVRRESTPIKLVFVIPSLQAAAAAVARLGGEMNPPERAWQFQGAAVLDGHDPEGNVFQLRHAG